MQGLSTLAWPTQLETIAELRSSLLAAITSRCSEKRLRALPRSLSRDLWSRLSCYGWQLTEVGAGFFAALVVVLIGQLALHQGLEGLLRAHRLSCVSIVQSARRTALGVVAADLLLGFQGRRQSAG